MHRAFKLYRSVARNNRRILVLFIAACIDIDFWRSDEIHQPMSAFCVLFNLELAAADTHDIAGRLHPFHPLRPELNAALNIGIVDVDGVDMNFVVVPLQMHTKGMRLLLVHPALIHAAMRNSARRNRELSLDVKFCIPRRPDATHRILTAFELRDCDISIDFRLGFPTIRVYMNAAHSRTFFPCLINRPNDTDIEKPPIVRRRLIAKKCQSSSIPKINAGCFRTRIRQPVNPQIKIISGKINLFLSLYHSDRSRAIPSVDAHRDRRIFRQRLIRILDRPLFRRPCGRLP